MRPKPFTVWPLVVDGKPLWDRGIVNSGALLELRVAFLNRALGEEFFSIMASTRRFLLFKSEVVIDTISAREVRLTSSSSSAFRVEFLSPTRFETPPYVKRPTPVYDLTPRPLNLFKSAVKTAMRLGLVDARWARRFLRWAYASVGVADFGCRGRCVVSVRLSGGRRLRGFVGWALYRAFETSMLGDMWRMLSVAEAFGVGSNRPLGLGAVRVTPLQ
ncbi:CRISPR-associated endoribonuclease Cas6 [Pyrobaculum sp. WP30]|nr:CRISPR-associated endoribonuclease Cas6 [Pyrobaculum sp. WP30]